MKADNALFAVPLALLSLPLVSSPANAEESETRALTGFNAVEVSGGIELALRQGDVFRVEVVADGDLDEIVTEVHGGKLEIRRQRPPGFFNWWGSGGSVSVTLPALVALTASGGSEVRTEGTFSSDGLSIVASGGSDLGLDVAAATLEVTASGGSDLRLSGTAGSARVQSSGGSDLNASALTVGDADVRSSGGSDISIAVRDKIVGSASGGSDIHYTGQPATVDINSSGGSDVTRR
jgi:hypothetical protein